MPVCIGRAMQIERFELRQWADDLQRSAEFHHLTRVVDCYSDLSPYQPVKLWNAINAYGVKIDPFVP